MSSNSPEERFFNIGADPEYADLEVQASLLRVETLDVRLARPLLVRSVEVETYPEGLRESGGILDYIVPEAA